MGMGLTQSRCMDVLPEAVGKWTWDKGDEVIFDDLEFE